MKSYKITHLAKTNMFVQISHFDAQEKKQAFLINLNDQKIFFICLTAYVVLSLLSYYLTRF